MVNTAIQNAYVGSTAVSAIYLGNTKLFPTTSTATVTINVTENSTKISGTKPTVILTNASTSEE